MDWSVNNAFKTFKGNIICLCMMHTVLLCIAWKSGCSLLNGLVCVLLLSMLVPCNEGVHFNEFSLSLCYCK